LLPEAVRRVRAENSPPGAPKRQRKSSAAKTPAPTIALEEVPEMPTVGYGTSAAMEAAVFRVQRRKRTCRPLFVAA
jgi:hypothetical protein